MLTHSIYFFSQEQDTQHYPNLYGKHEFEVFINGKQFTEIEEFTERNNPPKYGFSDAKIVFVYKVFIKKI